MEQRTFILFVLYIKLSENNFICFFMDKYIRSLLNNNRFIYDFTNKLVVMIICMLSWIYMLKQVLSNNIIKNCFG